MAGVVLGRKQHSIGEETPPRSWTEQASLQREQKSSFPPALVVTVLPQKATS